MFRRKETARGQNERVAEEVAALRLEDLERRLGLDSSTSSKPPARRRTSSLRRKSKRKSGGQPGHKGTTLRQTAAPDHVEEHWPEQCGDCGAPLAAADAVGQPVARQVFDLPEPQPLEATEHRAHACRCGQCGSTTRAAFPEGVKAPAQYGPRLAATAVYLQNFHFLPEDRLAELLRELFDVTLCAATVAAMTGKAAERWRGFAERIGAWIGTVARVKHLDETGFRICGRTQWLHVLCTPLLTFYRTSARRGAVGEGLTGCLVHDHWASYFRLGGVLHGLCNAHHLRELQALVKIDKEAWARRMQRLLRRAARAVRIAQEQGVPLPRSLLERIRRRYDRLLEEALAYHRGLEPLASGKRGRKKRRPGHNLALRLRDRKASALRFLTDFEVPFTNNLAEQDLRMMKLRMKISGGFRSAQGARDFATLRSVLSTARKQGWNAIEALLTPPEELFARLQS
jgi:transposase